MFFPFSVCLTRAFSEKDSRSSGGNSYALGGDDILHTNGFPLKPILPPEFLFVFLLLISDLVACL